MEYDYRVRTLPFHAYDKDVYQLFTMFSPDFTKHIDVDPVNRLWIIRESKSGKAFFSIPKTFLYYNPKEKNCISEQTRFMAWENNRHISIVDVMAQPLIHEIIEIPETADEEPQNSYEICSGTVPYLEECHDFYRKSYKNSPEEREIGIHNYFKAKRKIDVYDVRQRLIRMHNRLKTAWYIRPGDKAISKQV